MHEFLKELNTEFGTQSISVTIDIKKVNNEYLAYINNGKLNTQIRPDDFIERIYGYVKD